MVTRGMARSTISTYIHHCANLVRFHGNLQPPEMEARHIQEYLSHLANAKRVSPATQKQALNAIVFLFRETMNKNLGDFSKFDRAPIRRRLPVVLSQNELKRLFGAMTGAPQLMARLMYGSGIRVNECLSLRFQDVAIDESTLLVRSGKGDKDRTTIIPATLKDPLTRQLEFARTIWDQNRDPVSLPNAIGRKYPGAERELAWQWFWPAHGLSTDPDDGRIKRWHLTNRSIQTAFKRAVALSGIGKRATPHTMRHSFATHLCEAGEPLETIRKLLGHKRLETTMIYLHLADTPKTQSPLDANEL